MKNTFNMFFENVITKYNIKNNMVDAAFKVLKKINQELGEEALIVGGSVRDIIMGKEPHDVDIASSASPDQISQIFKTYDIGKSKDFGIVVVQQDGFDFEVAQFRQDSQESSDNRRPDSVEPVKSFKDDSSRRDFSINALGINADGEIVDYHGGLEDIKNQIIKAVGNPKQRFKEDALRILRMLRFASKTGFSIDPETLEAAKELMPLIGKLSFERIRDELYKSAGSGKGLARYIEGLDSIGALEKLLPEIYQMKSLKHNPKHHPEGESIVLGHVLEALKASKSDNPLVNLAVLFHDLGKITTLGEKDGQPTYHGHEAAGIPVFKAVADRLKISNSDREAIEFAILNHMHGHNMENLSDKLVLSLRQNPHWDLLKDVIYSDEASRGNLFDSEKYQQKMDKVDNTLKSYGDREEFESKMSKLINGKIIMDTIPGINGKKIGFIKDKVRDWIITQKFNVTPDQIKDKILEFSQFKENKFNELTDMVIEHYKNSKIYNEDNTAGGAMSVFGDVTSTETHFSGDNYAKGDARLPKVIGKKKIIRRNFPELTVFATGISKKKKKKN